MSDKPEEQQELKPSYDTIDEYEKALTFYKTRMNYLQCWQSSMRDPERKIVCDILANGFTLTTKKEIDDANSDLRVQVLGEFMEAIDFRFKDTEKGRMIIKTIREIKNNLSQTASPEDGLQEFPFRSIHRECPR